ncbi:unnamed protein product [Cuscuta epithymum]|uniref:Uncharacterized protein n=1 Tax=Cuscuta epithymum TaxID=186058 RepID=A0AAV0D5Q2_9ASTE|nr:unnamed protein product [Cuscuta epithymum]
MTNLSTNVKLSSRVRFMFKDAIEFSKNKWQQQRKVEGMHKLLEGLGLLAWALLLEGIHFQASSRGGSSMLPSQSLAQMGDFCGQDVRMENRHHSFDNRPNSFLYCINYTFNICEM